MYKTSDEDPYTSLPRRSRSNLRRGEPLRQPQVEENELHRERLLELLSVTISQERERIQVLANTLDLDVSLDSSLHEHGGVQHFSDSDGNTPDTTDSFRRRLWNFGEIASKNDYLLTPIRKRLFPKASPSVLRNLLSTPSLRISTPDVSGHLSDIPSSDSSRQARRAAATTENAYNLLARVSPLQLRSPEVTPFHPSDPIPYLTSHSLPPSPPQSTELPSAAFPTHSGSDAECALSEQTPSTRLATPSPEPYAAPRGSSHARSRHDLFPDTISSNLRASPCSPLVTRSAGGEGMPSESSPYLRPGLCRPSDPRLLMHNHLAFGVVRDFQRVLDELQGLGPRNAVTGCTVSAIEEVGLVPPSSPPRESVPSPDPRMQDQAIARSQAAASLLATSSREDNTAAAARLLPSLGPDLEDGSAYDKHEQRTIKDFSSWERPLELGDCDSRRSTAGSRSGRGASSQPPTSSSISGVQEEFVILLSDQASEEEVHARRLREMAEELQELACWRRQLAEVVSNQRL
ncbi:hypothetical protein C8T65DRAFT_825437 [Cerioporus squamosus]|nr:hypothetical protein C8T65DRAFT_825437 [Cerioporus squamosus]